MAVVFPGDGVLELIRSATGQLVIAAPYIKSPTLRRLLKAMPDAVSEFTCVTRWLPEDIASGVCDLEILDDVSQVKDGRLLVHPHLHAKYYSNNQQSLVGSANLTARGLGWHTPSNVELLVALPADFPGLAEWEQALLNSAVTATDQLRERIRARAKQLGQAGPMRHAPEVEENTEEEEEAAFWVPRCPAPERLWEVYRGGGADRMVSSAFEAAQEDLAALSPPSGLTQGLFTAYVAGILRQMPVLTEIDKLAAAGLTDTKAHEFLGDRLVCANDHEQLWRVIKQWLVFFFPDSYRLETGQEVLVKGRQLPRR
jgi:hypothetical protein